MSILLWKSREKGEEKGSEMDSKITAKQVWNEAMDRFRGRRPGENDYRELCRTLYGAIVRELRQTGDCSLLIELEEELQNRAVK